MLSGPVTRMTVLSAAGAMAAANTWSATKKTMNIAFIAASLFRRFLHGNLADPPEPKKQKDPFEGFTNLAGAGVGIFKIRPFMGFLL